jgi:hypothetical protein
VPGTTKAPTEFPETETEDSWLSRQIFIGPVGVVVEILMNVTGIIEEVNILIVADVESGHSIPVPRSAPVITVVRSWSCQFVPLVLKIWWT